MKNRSKQIWTLLSCFMIAIGCQSSVKTDYDTLDLANVSGTIKLDGAPLPNAYVIFQGEDLTYSFGKTDSNGRYNLMLNSEKAGILPGEKTVKIRLSRAFGAEGAALDNQSVGDVEASGDTETDSEDEGANEGQEPAKASRPAKNELPASYHAESKIKANVQSGSQTINFDLKPDGSTTRPE